MCTVSMIGDHYTDKFHRQYPQFFPSSAPPSPLGQIPIAAPVSRAEFEELKREVAEMVALLKRAKIYDEKNGEPACETDEKMAALRVIAKAIGVDLDSAIAG